jgi:hypothetical protein
VSKGRSRLGSATDVSSEWPESCLVIAAVLKGRSDVAYTLLIGFVAVKLFLLLGVCSAYLGCRDRKSTYPRLQARFHTLLLIINVSIISVLGMAELWFRGKSDSGQSVSVLCRITASAMLLLFAYYHVVVCRTHSEEVGQAYRLRNMVSPWEGSAPTDYFTCKPIFQITTRFAERFQDCRKVYIDTICDPVSKQKFSHGSRSDNATQNRAHASITDIIVICIVLAAACVIILVSSHHLLDSIPPKGTERRDVWPHFDVLLTTLIIGLADCIAVGVSQWWSGYYALAEEAVSAALGSSSRLLSALLSVSTLLGWSMGAAVLALPVNAFHCVLLVVAMFVQIVGKGW